MRLALLEVSKNFGFTTQMRAKIDTSLSGMQTAKWTVYASWVLIMLLLRKFNFVVAALLQTQNEPTF
jgi:hypothetical protein